MFSLFSPYLDDFHTGLLVDWVINLHAICPYIFSNQWYKAGVSLSPSHLIKGVNRYTARP